DGLQGNAVSCVLEDSPGKFWIGTEDGGLCYYEADKQRFSSYPFRAGQEPLSYHNIHALYKDSRGHIWIGTYSGGLNVRNPKTGKIRRYQHQPGNPSSISNNSVYSIYEDREGVIWVGTIK